MNGAGRWSGLNRVWQVAAGSIDPAAGAGKAGGAARAANCLPVRRQVMTGWREESCLIGEIIWQERGQRPVRVTRYRVPSVDRTGKLNPVCGFCSCVPDGLQAQGGKECVSSLVKRNRSFPFFLLSCLIFFFPIRLSCFLFRTNLSLCGFGTTRTCLAEEQGMFAASVLEAG